MKKGRWTITADKFLNKEQIQLLLGYVTQRRDLAIARGNDRQGIKDFYIVKVLLESGTRVSEFCRLRNADFLGLKLIVTVGKGGKPRTILLTRSTANLIKEWMSVKERLDFNLGPMAPLIPSRYDKQYSVRGIQDRIKIILRGCDLPDNLSVHSLRHTYCTLLLESKQVGLARVRDNMGHSSIAITDLYAHATGSIENVELLPTVENKEKHAGQVGLDSQKPSKSVRAFLRKTQLK